MNISNDLKNIYLNATKNNQKIDSNSFNEIKKEILKDGKVSSEEREFIIDILDNHDFKKGIAREVMSLLDDKYDEIPVTTQTSEAPVVEVKTPQNTTGTETPVEANMDKDGYPINWQGEGTLTGGFNFANGTKGEETRGNLAYQKTTQKGHHKFDFNTLGDYGKTTSYDTTGVKQTNFSGNALNADLTYSYELKNEPGAFNYAPYIKYETRGKISDIQERSYRTSSGLELTYKDESTKSDYDLKFGIAIENKYTKTDNIYTLDRENGYEMVFKGKQGLGFISPKYPLLSRMELAADFNATRLNSMDWNNGTNINSFFGGRIYMDDKENTFVEIGKKYISTSTQTEVSKESSTVVNVGFKM